MAGLTQSMLMTLKFEVLTYPVYSPELGPCNYEVCGLLKKILNGKCFSTDGEVKKEVEEWVLQVDAEFWGGVIYKLPRHWRTCCRHKKSSYVSNYMFFTLLHEWVDRGQTHQLEKLLCM